MRRPVVLFLLAWCLGFLTVSLAQDEVETESSKHVWIDEYTDGPVLLTGARQYVQKGEYREAIRIYQGLIEKVRREKGFASKVIASGEREEGIYLPVRECCYEEILRLPPQGRELYQVLYKAAAQRLYEQAAAGRDMAALAAIAQDYLLIPAGKKACMRLADLCMERAQYSLALHYLDTLANYHYRPAQEPALCALKRAACLVQSGQPEAARVLVDKLKEGDLTEAQSRICSYLLDAIEAIPSSSREVFNNFYDGFVNLKSPPGAKLVEPVDGKAPESLGWRFGFERKGGSARSQPRRFQYGYLTARGELGYDFYPVYHNGLVFVNDSNHIFAFAASSGKMRWKEPEEDYGKLDGLPLGCFVANGKLFAVLRNSNPLGAGSRNKVVPSFNELYCFDADGRTRHGRKHPLWHTGTKRARIPAGAAGYQTGMGRRTSLLGQTTFTSIPFVDGSRVYVAGTEIADKEQYYGVACFRTDGMFLWETRFCVTKWVNSSARAALLLRAATLTVSHGKVIVCTNVGVAAALSAFTGEVEWIYKYPQHPSRGPRGGGFQGRDRVTWEPTPPIVWYGRHPNDKKPLCCLVLTPGDSEFIFGLDMNTPKEMWCMERSGHRYVIGPRGDDIFVYGGRSLYPESGTGAGLVVRQHSIPDGGLVRWEARLDEKEMGKPIGKGVATPGALYIPCEKKLLEIVSGKLPSGPTGAFSKVAAPPPEGMIRGQFYGKVSVAASWPEHASQAKAGPTDGTRAKSKREIKLRTQTPGSARVPVLDEEQSRGNLLVLPGKIIIGGYRWITCFKFIKEKQKEDKNGDK